MAHIQPPGSFCWNLSPHLYGYTKVNYTIFFVSFLDCKFQRTEEEREVNHHGRPVKVSEEDDEENDQANKAFKLSIHQSLNTWYRCIQCLLCLLMRQVLEDQSNWYQQMREHSRKLYMTTIRGNIGEQFLPGNSSISITEYK